MQWLAALFTLFGVFSSAAAQPAEVAIGYSGISADQLVIWVARDTGIFAKNNLDTQAIYFSGGTLSVTAMISGDTPLIQASGPGIISASLAGAEPVYVVGGIVTLDYQLITQPDIKHRSSKRRHHRRRPLRRARISPRATLWPSSASIPAKT
jgi:ABC-type nitrate/sulfonate/bicarbonate transport system substrate-binding protein